MKTTFRKTNRQMIAQTKRMLRTLFIDSWWVIAFVLMCSILYEQGLKLRNELYQQLVHKQSALQQKKEKLMQKKHNLQLQINSQSDLAWIELTLMKGLGLTPEGQQKVYFVPDERCRITRQSEDAQDLSITLR